jgi:hypothetical protein
MVHKTLIETHINVILMQYRHNHRLYTYVLGLVSTCYTYLKQTTHLYGIIKTEAVI